MERNVGKPILFEIAWEVANKVGGIYTVIRSKVPVTSQEYGNDRYCLLGPLNAKSAALEVEEIEATNVYFKESIQQMRSNGIKVLYGKWLIESSPTVVLFDLNSAFHRLNEWKADLWEKAFIPTPENDFEVNDAIVFGYLVAWFLGEYSFRNTKNAIIAHFHEWLAAVGLILVKKRNIDVATIFTTHATILGRYLCAGSVDFYNSLHMFDVDFEAGRRQIYHRYCLERGGAHTADVFTTVSHITAYEAENLLKKKPDGVLPNGLNVVKFSAMHEFQNLHAQFKEKIHNFTRGHFYGHYDFDLDNTLYFFTAGRYEYRNKGVDLFLEALYRVNQQLKYINSPITVVAFIIMPAATNNFTVDTLKGQAVIKQLQDTVEKIQQNVGKRIFESCLRQIMPKPEELLPEEEIVLLKRRLYSLKRDSLPPVVTHNMFDDANDPILNHIRRLGLVNRREDRVKIIFHPEFLNSNNPIFGLDYEDFVRGCHLGVFPSYYEPWGYTPAECTVMGVPSITTNLSGFGCYIEENIENPSDYGIYIVDRRMKSVEESIQQLADSMLSFSHKSRRQRINQRNRTERLSDFLDWRRMGLEYVKARYLALRRKYPKSLDRVDTESSEEEGLIEEVLEDDQVGSLDSRMITTGKKLKQSLSTSSSPKMKTKTEIDQVKVQTFLDVKVEESLVLSPDDPQFKIVQDKVAKIELSK